MRKFLISISIFLATIVVFLVALELLVHTIPNSYSYKYNYIKKNGRRIEAIAMGHSQLYDGFKPESFKLPAFNLCNSAQSFKEDYYLLKELLPYMPNLKCVILPIGYMNVTDNSDEESFTERSTFYHEYMNVNYDNRIPVKHRLECFYPNRAFEKATSYYLHHIDIVGCDSLGRRSTHNLKDRKFKLGHENVLNDYTSKTHDPNKMHIQVEDYLERIARFLNNENITFVLVSPPHYWSCFDNINLEQKAFLQDYISFLKSKYNIQYFNLEDDNRFEDKDYYNETHLSEIGAEKFTKILNDSISVN